MTKSFFAAPFSIFALSTSSTNAQSTDNAARGLAAAALSYSSPVGAVTPAPGAQLAPTGFVRWGPQQASLLLKSIANVNVTTQTRVASHWALVGDSVAAGHCALGSCVDSRISSYLTQLGTMMNNAGIPTTNDSWFGCSNHSTTTTCAAFDTRLTINTGWTIQSQYSFGGFILEFPASTAPTALTFTPNGPWNQEDVYVIAGAAASTFTFDRGGSTAGESCAVVSQTGATTSCSGGTVTTTSGVPGLALVQFTWTGNAIIANSNVNATSSGTGKFFVIGEALRDTNNPKIELYNGGIGGSTSATWTTSTIATYGTLSMLGSTYLNPVVTLDALGINDWNTPVTTIPTFTTNMTTLQTLANSTGMNIFIYDIQSNPALFSSVATQNTYGAVLQRLSQTANQPFVNFQYRWTNWANAVTMGFMGNPTGTPDGRHGSAPGYQDLAEFLNVGINNLISGAGKYPGASLGANAFTDAQTITAAPNTYSLNLTPPSLTSGTTGFGVNVTGVVNDSSAVDGIAQFINVTCTTCTATSFLADWKVGGVSLFSVTTGGQGTIAGGIAAGGGLSVGSSITIANASNINWSGKGILYSPAVGDIQLGNPNAASPVNQTLSTQGSRGGTDTNVAGGNLVIQAGLGTGSATGSTLILQTPHATTTGTTAQSANTQISLGDNTVAMPNLGSSSAATTGTVCWTTGTGNLNVDTTTTCLLSDGRLKENIRPLESGLEEVMSLRPVSYDVKASVDPVLHGLGRQVGLVAQDVIKVDPRLVSLYKVGPDTGTPNGVRYEQLTAVLIKAIQEEQAEIGILRTRIGRLEHTH